VKEKLVLLLASGAVLLVGCQERGKDPEWQPATESVVYEVCRHDYENQPCVQRAEDGEVFLYRAGRTPTEVDVLWVEEDGRWRVVVK
jgi:hypothetical protein